MSDFIDKDKQHLWLLRTTAQEAKPAKPAVAEVANVSPDVQETFEAEAKAAGLSVYWFSRGARIWAKEKSA